MIYISIYNKIIDRARFRDRHINVYYEKHHIIPRSLNGLDCESNLVYLTAKEHFVAHHLLYKIHRNQEMTKAFMLMCNVERGGERFRISAKGYQKLKEDASKVQRERMLGGISPAKGKKWSQESKDRLSESLKGHNRGNGGVSFKGMKHSQETKDTISQKMKGNTNHAVPHSQETKNAMSANRLGKTKIPWTEERKAARRVLLAEKKKSK